MNKLVKWLIPYGFALRHIKARDSHVLTAAQEALYRPLVPAGGLVFDIGANIGNRIDAFLRCGARVIAVEPQPKCADALRRRYRREVNVEVVEAAVGAKPGRLPLRFSATGDTMASLSAEFAAKMASSGRFGEGKRWDRTIEVEVTTLDALISRFGDPAFVKIDVEGFEDQVLAGLGAPIAALSFEWTPDLEEHAARCLDHCARLGLSHFQVSFGEHMRFAFRRSIDLDRVKAFVSSLSEEPVLFGDIYASRTRMDVAEAT